ncbi:MAG: DNA/RNA nuclease SfsA [Oscillospiraceae bacterium]|nr:DNA/RNA nuclease SfsA [Oscillospiraceae bacterium]
MTDVTEVRASANIHPEFALALEEAQAAGVEVLFLQCRVAPEELESEAQIET